MHNYSNTVVWQNVTGLLCTRVVVESVCLVRNKCAIFRMSRCTLGILIILAQYIGYSVSVGEGKLCIPERLENMFLFRRKECEDGKQWHLTSRPNRYLQSSGRSSADILREVSIIIDDHEVVGPELGLTEAEITAINCDGSTEDHRKLEMLQIWKRKYSCEATYRVFIEALLKCSRADHAQRVCELLAESKCYDITWSYGYYFDVIAQFVITNIGEYAWGVFSLF